MIAMTPQPLFPRRLACTFRGNNNNNHDNNDDNNNNIDRSTMSFPSLSSTVHLILPLLLCHIVPTVAQYDEVHVENQFRPSTTFPVLGPNTFPKPSDMVALDAQIALGPSLGHHRPDRDAVLAYAEGYPLQNYIVFIESLLATGFDGDIVLAVASLGSMAEGVQEYLESHINNDNDDTNNNNSIGSNVVIYATQFNCTQDGLEAERTQDGGGKMSFQMCQLHNLYATADGQPQPDPRAGRVVATSRYELYWIWAKQYNKQSWLMLLDARDAYFQSNPFSDLPRRRHGVDTTTDDDDVDSGMLYFFGVSME